jgi:hypothetical protein
MNELSLTNRVTRLKQRLEEYAASSEHSLDIESVSSKEIERLRCLDYFPRDMLLVLEQIGCMREWGNRGCAMIDWWQPCKIETAMKHERCAYEFSYDLLVDGDSLLFFACDCDAKVYFYLTNVVPWKVVWSDGLNLSLADEYALRTGSTQQGSKFGYLECPVEEGSALLGIIEVWADLP